jgi:hypothetical protein
MPTLFWFPNVWKSLLPLSFISILSVGPRSSTLFVSALVSKTPYPTRFHQVYHRRNKTLRPIQVRRKYYIQYPPFILLRLNIPRLFSNPHYSHLPPLHSGFVKFLSGKPPAMKEVKSCKNMSGHVLTKSQFTEAF